MSHIWTFSLKSQLLLQQCLNAAAPPDDSNIWYQRFGRQDSKLLTTANNIVIIDDSPDMETTHLSKESQVEDISKVLEDFLDPDLDVITKFDTLQKKSMKNSRLLAEIAKKLPLNITSQLILHIFHHNDIDNEFLTSFFKYFIPTYIKKDNSRMCIDLLAETRKIYPQFLSIILKEIMANLEVQSNIVNDYILTLNVDEQTDFLNMVKSLELSSEQFLNNLHNIYTAYKNCNKTESIQEVIFNLLKTHSQFCEMDKTYGKLFLSFLQEEKLKSKTDLIAIQKVLEIHKSPFKRPCFAIINELKTS